MSIDVDAKCVACLVLVGLGVSGVVLNLKMLYHEWILKD